MSLWEAFSPSALQNDALTHSWMKINIRPNLSPSQSRCNHYGHKVEQYGPSDLFSDWLAELVTSWRVVVTREVGLHSQISPFLHAPFMTLSPREGV